MRQGRVNGTLRTNGAGALFSYRVISQRGWVVLALDGELDVLHLDDVRRTLMGIKLARGGGFALDLRGLRFMDSGGVRLVLQALQHADRHGAEFALVRGPHAVQYALDLIGLTDQLNVVDHPSLLDDGRPFAPPCPGRYGDVVEAIGNTPLVELKRLSPKRAVRLWAKLESHNPTGSVKDRVARALIEDAEKRGAIRGGRTILEPTSGNTGISLAMICARKGYPLKVVMPDNVTPERTQLLKMYGADIVYSPGAKGSNGAVEMALAMAEADPSYYMPYQYGNDANPRAHYDGTGREILEKLDDVSAFVAGLGTGGTLMGVGRRLREELGSAVKIVAAEPMPGEGVQGLRSLDDGFIPPIVDLSLLDRKILVTNRDAIVWTRRLLEEEGIFAGVSSGAIASVAVRIARELDEGDVVFVVCDGGWKYLSSGVHTMSVDDVANVETTAWW